MAASYVITNKTTQIFFARSSCFDFYRLYKKQSQTLKKARNNFTDFFVFQLVARKLIEILDKIIALKVGCVNQKSYSEILKHIKRSSILCSHPTRKR